MPAIGLGGALPYVESSTDSKNTATNNSNERYPDFKKFFRSAEAIANSGDTLVVLADQRLHGITEALEQLYMSRGVTSVLLAPASAASNSRAGNHTIHIPLEYDTIAGIHEMSLFILDTLGDMIEAGVFGGKQLAK